MNYNEEFLREEIRCDFLVDINRKKIWATQLDLYKELMRVCTKYNLKCFAMGGTLLGAVRHKGFIPWDDDMDLALTRTDFEKLCEVANQEFKNPYFFQTALTDKNYFTGIARLRNSNTTGIVNYTSNHVYNNGIFIDIFVYDTIPENSSKLNKQIRKLKFWERLLNNYYHINAAGKSKLLSPIYWLISKIFTYDYLYKKYKKIITMYNNSDSNLLGLLSMHYWIKYIATKGGVENLIELDFEDTKILAPSDYDLMLKKAYGNYMEFPPIEKRGQWHQDVIIFDPDIPFYKYYQMHADKYTKVLKEYNKLNKKSR